MLSVQQLAEEFNIKPEQLIEESLRLYLHQQLVKIDTELFHYAQKYGVKTITEFDEKLQQGLLTEDDIQEDFFAFDQLEYEKERLLELLKTSEGRDACLRRHDTICYT
ncbi:hypothetical protein GF339_11615 [candidate division KSB3 bacterium]|uniref:Uncharacterized protein n=1 Tax=candidate division KSB3 bacterium TaxID=2044937 RepID=A0A9D5JW41_9BACT|nr:hypothetical protein [candidate division KSB3 bacterium]MBD3325225.1 hypothetical protein [candidate division KSB3 bacterium]